MIHCGGSDAAAHFEKAAAKLFSHERTSMFPEYRALISRLKTEDRHFERLFNEHNDLDEKITELEKHISPVGEVEIETLKKKKLALKDEIYQILLKASK